jgi:deoxyribonuclease-4
MIKMGPSGMPTRESPEAAIELLLRRRYTAVEIDFEGGFWLEKEEALRLGGLARREGISLSIHAPLPAFLGHLERDMKYKRAMGMLDHCAGLAQLCGADIVVLHPGFLLGRGREEALAAVVEQLGELGDRLAAKDRLVPFGIEAMGRVRDLGSVEDILWLARRFSWTRPVLDFAHLHAVSDGGLLRAHDFAALLEPVDSALPAGVPFHIHFSDIAFANRNESKHLPYGQGTLRAEPLREALKTFDRPATVISESPDEGSHRAIRSILLDK